MKTIILTIAITLIGLTSCKKNSKNCKNRTADYEKNVQAYNTFITTPNTLSPSEKQAKLNMYYQNIQQSKKAMDNACN